MESTNLYIEGPKKEAKAPILITHFDGAMDAGSAGGMAVLQLLRSLSPQRVATFEPDGLIDFRSHRPLMVVEDGQTKQIVEPEIALDLLHDDTGTPLLLLHGPEPDAQWGNFTRAVAELADRAGVEIVFSLMGIPTTVPHTRPTVVQTQSTDGEQVPAQLSIEGSWAVPAPLTQYLQHKLAEQNLHGVTLYASVPYYMADSGYPRAASSLLRTLADVADLSLPIGDLERGADSDATAVEELIGANPEVQQTIAALEAHYDALPGNMQASEMADSGAEINDAQLFDFIDAEMAGAEDPASPNSIAQVMGESIETYLRARSRLERSRPRAPVTPAPPAPPGPKHRAPRPWEETRDPVEQLDAPQLPASSDNAEPTDTDGNNCSGGPQD